MFERNVTSTPFYNDDANLVFGNITGDTFRGDVTFISALRAMLGKRIGDGSLDFYLLSKTPRGNGDENKLMEELGIRETDIRDNTLTLINVIASPEDLPRHFEILHEKIVPLKLEKGWAIAPGVREYFGSIEGGVVCLTNAEHKCTLLIVGNIGIKQSHWLASTIPLYFPWYFPELQNGVTKDEMAMCISLTPDNKEKKGTNFLNALKVMAAEYNFREKKLMSLLTGFTSSRDRDRMDQLRRDIESIRRSMSDLMDTYAAKASNLHDKEISIAGIQSRIDSNEGDNELVDYFICHPNLTLLNAYNGDMKFETRGYLAYFDEEAVEVYLKRSGSPIYRPDGYDYSDEISGEDMARLIKAIFIDQTLRLRVCAAFQFSGTNARALSKSDYSHYTDESKEFTPNSHIWYHACIDRHRHYMQESLGKNDYIGAIEQALASTMTLNVHDATVFNEFMKVMYGHGGSTFNSAHIEAPDGSVMSTKEAIEWLKKQEGQHE